MDGDNLNKTEVNNKSKSVFWKVIYFIAAISWLIILMDFVGNYYTKNAFQSIDLMLRLTESCSVGNIPLNAGLAYRDRDMVDSYMKKAERANFIGSFYFDTHYNELQTMYNAYSDLFYVVYESNLMYTVAYYPRIAKDINTFNNTGLRVGLLVDNSKS